jgi:dihydropteroate synthase
MQQDIHFEDVFVEVAQELAERVQGAHAAGLRRVVIDPGIGFGKHTSHNLELIRRAGELARVVGKPVLIGASRKSFLGEVAGIPEAQDRLGASIVAAALAARAGASFLRVHDVAATRQALCVAQALA